MTTKATVREDLRAALVDLGKVRKRIRHTGGLVPWLSRFAEYCLTLPEQRPALLAKRKAEDEAEGFVL